jgi:glyceraldehyde 3-phosphate dehydrogenase
VSAPVKDGDAANIVYGVNDDIYDPTRHNIVTAASCTTNCLAPVVKVIHENLKIKHGSITTIHDVTNTQTYCGPPRQRLAACAFGAELADPDDDGQCDGDHADLP